MVTGSDILLIVLLTFLNALAFLSLNAFNHVRIETILVSHGMAQRINAVTKLISPILVWHSLHSSFTGPNMGATENIREDSHCSLVFKVMEVLQEKRGI
jgi:hypothetical protein